MKSKLVIVDIRCSEEIFNHLTPYTEEVFRFCTIDQTYTSISCHPDIFIFKEQDRWILAPNSPSELRFKFDELGVDYLVGVSVVGAGLSDSCYYNALSTGRYFFHRKGFTDSLVLSYQNEKQKIYLPQSYTRCSLLNITERAFITSDAGIHKVLKDNLLESFYFSPEEIRIETHRYGFLGGTCGIYRNRIFFLGNPLKHKDGKQLCHFIESQGLEVVSLSNDYLYDGGGVFFV